MQSIIMNTFGILLATASAGTTVYYGDTAVQSGIAKVKASGALSAAAQTSDALQMYSLQEGRDYESADLGGLVDANYLRRLPRSPAGGEPARLAMLDGVGAVVALPVTEDQQRICAAAEKVALQSGASDRAGCAAIDGQVSIYDAV